jgi:hypothetical protein
VTKQVSYFHCRPTAVFFTISVINFYFEDEVEREMAVRSGYELVSMSEIPGKGLTHLLVLVKGALTLANRIESCFFFFVVSGDSECMRWFKGVAMVLPYIAVCIEYWNVTVQIGRHAVRLACKTVIGRA